MELQRCLKVVEELMQSAHAQGISIETLVNVILIVRVRKSVAPN